MHSEGAMVLGGGMTQIGFFQQRARSDFLTDEMIRDVPPPSKEVMLSDGENLALRIRPLKQSPYIRKEWFFVYRRHKRTIPTKMKIGNYPELALEDARVKAADYCLWRAKGIDPLARRKELAEAKNERSVIGHAHGANQSWCALLLVDDKGDFQTICGVSVRHGENIPGSGKEKITCPLCYRVWKKSRLLKATNFEWNSQIG